MVYTEMQQLLRGRFNDASSGRFADLRRIPSTTVWRTLGFLDSLSEERRSAILTTCTAIAEENIEVAFGLRAPTPTPVGAEADSTPRCILGREIFSTPSHWSGFPDRFMRQFAANPDLLRQMVDTSRLPRILECKPPTIAKAPAIRKALHNHLKTSFNAEFDNLGSGEWTCNGIVNGTLFCMHLDYGGKGGGFRYAVFFPPNPNGPWQGGALTLESTFGFPSGVCDFVISDELGELCDAMSMIVEELGRLREKALEQ